MHSSCTCPGIPSAEPMDDISQTKLHTACNDSEFLPSQRYKDEMRGVFAFHERSYHALFAHFSVSFYYPKSGAALISGFFVLELQPNIQKRDISGHAR